MTEAQTWTAIGAFTTTVFAMLTIVSWLFVHVVRSEVGKVSLEVAALHGELKGDIAGLRGEMNAMDARLTGEISAMDARLTGEIGNVATKLDHLDRDVQAIARRVFPETP